jgi:hypothetical protein
MFLLVAPLILGICFIAAGLWLTWRRGGQVIPTNAMACVACGAPAAALTTFICHGCGNDVRTQGIAPALARVRWRVHPVIRVAILALVLATVAAMIVTGGTLRGGRFTRYNQTLFPESSDATGLTSAELSIDVHKLDDRIVAGTGTVTIVTAAALATLDVDLPTLAATINSDNGPVGPPAGLTAATFDDLARAAGLDPADSRVRAQFDVIRASFEPMVTRGELAQGSPPPRTGAPLFGSMSGGGGTSSVPAPMPSRWVFASAAAAWLAGTAWLFRRRGDGHGAATVLAAERGVA